MTLRMLVVLSCLGCAFACGGDDSQEALDPAGQAGAGGFDSDDSNDDDDSNDGDNDTGSDDGAGDGDGDDDAPAADPNEPAAPGVPPTFTPNFPGAGTSGDDEPLTNGMLCDYVPANGAPTPNEITTCFFGDDPVPAATLEQVLECSEGNDVVHIRLTFNPDFVDNTYGENSIGWGADADGEPMDMPPAPIGMEMMKMKRGKGAHTFEQLVKSDHAEILMVDENGETILQFKLDYLTEDASAPSGYASLGVQGGEGEVLVGNPAWIVGHMTSIDRNLNERGYGSYTTDSPATDADYTPNPDAPEWDYRVVYEAWIDVEAFGEAGFGKATIEFVHASPAKSDNDTIEVEPDECPPDECGDTPDEDCGDDPPDEDPCGDNPDEDCGDGEPPPDDDGDPIDCEPGDPACDPE